MKWEESNVDGVGFKLIRYGNGMWIAGSYTNKGLYYSIDGKTWVQSNITTYNCHDAYYANGLWVAALRSPSSSLGLWYSSDGKNWGQSNITNVSLAAVYNANGLWVAGGSAGFYYSADGKAWTKSSSSGYCNILRYGNGIWVSGGPYDEFSNYSTDGKTWARCSGMTSGVHSLAYGNGIWVATDEMGYQMFYSTDGKSWVEASTSSSVIGFDNYMCDAYYSNGLWVALGISYFWYSTDGKIWTRGQELSRKTTNLTHNARFCNDNGIWVVADGDNVASYYSVDGKSWIESSKDFSIMHNFCDVQCENGMWVLCSQSVVTGGSSLYYSPTWEPTIPAGEYMFSNNVEMPSCAMTENISFTSNNTSYSKMKLQEQS